MKIDYWKVRLGSCLCLLLLSIPVLSQQVYQAGSDEFEAQLTEVDQEFDISEEDAELIYLISPGVDVIVQDLALNPEAGQDDDDTPYSYCVYSLAQQELDLRNAIDAQNDNNDPADPDYELLVNYDHRCGQLIAWIHIMARDGEGGTHRTTLESRVNLGLMEHCGETLESLLADVDGGGEVTHQEAVDYVSADLLSKLNDDFDSDTFDVMSRVKVKVVCDLEQPYDIVEIQGS